MGQIFDVQPHQPKATVLQLPKPETLRSLCAECACHGAFALSFCSFVQCEGDAQEVFAGLE